LGPPRLSRAGELAEALDGLSPEEQRAITSESAIALYGIGG
jgi:hypothetical protein